MGAALQEPTPLQAQEKQTLARYALRADSALKAAALQMEVVFAKLVGIVLKARSQQMEAGLVPKAPTLIPALETLHCARPVHLDRTI